MSTASCQVRHSLCPALIRWPAEHGTVSPSSVSTPPNPPRNIPALIPSSRLGSQVDGQDAAREAVKHDLKLRPPRGWYGGRHAGERAGHSRGLAMHGKGEGYVEPVPVWCTYISH